MDRLHIKNKKEKKEGMGYNETYAGGLYKKMKPKEELLKMSIPDLKKEAEKAKRYINAIFGVISLNCLEEDKK